MYWRNQSSCSCLEQVLEGTNNEATSPGGVFVLESGDDIGLKPDNTSVGDSREMGLISKHKPSHGTVQGMWVLSAYDRQCQGTWYCCRIGPHYRSVHDESTSRELYLINMTAHWSGTKHTKSHAYPTIPIRDAPVGKDLHENLDSSHSTNGVRSSVRTARYWWWWPDHQENPIDSCLTGTIQRLHALRGFFSRMVFWQHEH